MAAGTSPCAQGLICRRRPSHGSALLGPSLREPAPGHGKGFEGNDTGPGKAESLGLQSEGQKRSPTGTASGAPIGGDKATRKIRPPLFLGRRKNLQEVHLDPSAAF